MLSDKRFWVYILHCADGSYYTGRAVDLQKRIRQHQSGQICGYTLSRRPVQLVFSQSFKGADEANRAERQVKGWSRAKKEALIAGDFDLLHDLAECRNPSSHVHHEHQKVQKDPPENK